MLCGAVLIGPRLAESGCVFQCALSAVVIVGSVAGCSLFLSGGVAVLYRSDSAVSLSRFEIPVPLLYGSWIPPPC